MQINLIMKFKTSLLSIFITLAVVFWGMSILLRIFQYISGTGISSLQLTTLLGGSVGILLIAYIVRYFYVTVITDEKIKGSTFIGNIIEIEWVNIVEVKSIRFAGLKFKVFKPKAGAAIWVMLPLDNQAEFDIILENIQLDL